MLGRISCRPGEMAAPGNLPHGNYGTGKLRHYAMHAARG